jgi:hypothetical protein
MESAIHDLVRELSNTRSDRISAGSESLHLVESEVDVELELREVEGEPGSFAPKQRSRRSRTIQRHA